MIRPSIDEAKRLRKTLHATASPRVRVALEHALAETAELQARVESVPVEVEVEHGVNVRGDDEKEA